MEFTGIKAISTIKFTPWQTETIILQIYAW